MIKYPLKLKITFVSMPDLNYRIVKEGNEMTYEIVDDDSVHRPRYKVTSDMIEEKALFEILYEILYDLDLTPADLAATVTQIHSEILVDDRNDFIFNQVRQSIFIRADTRRG